MKFTVFLEDLRAPKQYEVKKTLYKDEGEWVTSQPAKHDDKIEAGSFLDIGHDSKGKGCVRLNGTKPGAGPELKLEIIAKLLKNGAIVKVGSASKAP